MRSRSRPLLTRWPRLTSTSACPNTTSGMAGVWSVADRHLLYRVSVDDDYGTPFAVMFSPDGKLLATGGGIGAVRFWDATSGAADGRSIIGEPGWVESLSFDPTGRDDRQRRHRRNRPHSGRHGAPSTRDLTAHRRRAGLKGDVVPGRDTPVHRGRDRSRIRVGRRAGCPRCASLRDRRSHAHDRRVGRRTCQGGHTSRPVPRG